jgi:WD40 repeat protein
MVAFQPDSRRCAVGHANGLVRILDCRSFEESARYETGVTGSPLAVAWNPRLPQIAIMDRNQWRIIDADSGTTISNHVVNEGLGGWPAWDPTGKRLSAGVFDNNIGIWDSMTTDLTVAPIHGHLNGGTIVRFCPDGNRLVSNDWSHIIRLWDTTIGPPEPIANIATENTWASSGNGEVVLVPTQEGGVLWDSKTRQQTLLPHPPDVRTCAVTADGRIGVTASHALQDIAVKIWNLDSGKWIADLEVPGFTGAFLSPDGKWLVTNGNGTRLWRVGEWKESRVLQPFRTLPCFSPDSRLLALSDDISVIRLLEPETCREVAVLTAPERTRLLPLTFTPDGARLISYGEETGALHIFDLRAIRRQLAEMDLDWDFPPLLPESQDQQSDNPLKFSIDIGTYENLNTSLDVSNTTGVL